MKRSVIGLITAMTVTASVGQAADLKIENGPRFSITCTGALETRNGIYFFNREKPITGLTPEVHKDRCAHIAKGSVYR